MSHLLTLAALHAAAPGVLDVVFGADGDFPGAPSWAGPMTSMARYPRHSWLVWRGLFHASVGTDDGHWSCTVDEWRERWALDCRVLAVEDHLKRLCARALDMPKWRAGVQLRKNGDTYRLSTIGRDLSWHGTGACYPASGPHPSLPSEPADLPSFLAALTLALAPRIAALGGVR